MRYSAGMVSQVFALVESRKTAELLNQGKTKEEIKKLAINENIYQVRTETRRKRTFSYVYNRITSLPDELIKLLPTLDIDSAKVLVLIGIMRTDLLFFEFIYEVYREKLIVGENKIENRDLNAFFDEKANQSDIVEKWSESGVQKLKNCYVKNLVDAGLMDSSINRKIKPALINYRLEEILKKNGMETYLKAVQGIR